MKCACRNCGAEYVEEKSRADWKGYCSQACFHDMARKHGYSAAREKKLGRTHSEYSILNRVHKIGSVPAQPKPTEDPMPNPKNVVPNKGSFPETLYVSEPVDPGSSFDAYAGWEDAEDGDVIGVYKLEKIVRVKETRKKELLDA